jgi:hypothetical protein
MNRRRAVPFSLAAKRTREIAMLVLHRHRGLPDTDDRDVYLELAAHHLKPKDGDIPFALGNWARRLGATLPERELIRIAETARAKRRQFKADTIGKILRVTYEERCAARISTIGCIDVSKTERTKRRKERRLVEKQNSRRNCGIIPRREYIAKSLTRTKPWLAEGISRRTWYRRRSTQPATAPAPPAAANGHPRQPWHKCGTTI